MSPRRNGGSLQERGPARQYVSLPSTGCAAIFDITGRLEGFLERTNGAIQRADKLFGSDCLSPLSESIVPPCEIQAQRGRKAAYLTR